MSTGHCVYKICRQMSCRHLHGRTSLTLMLWITTAYGQLQSGRVLMPKLHVDRKFCKHEKQPNQQSTRVGPHT